MRRLLRTIILGVIVGLVAGAAHAQQAVAASPAGQTETQSSRTLDRIGDNHYIRKGDVEIDLGDTKIYADEVEVFTDQDRLIASGNVVLSRASDRIASDRADFNMKTKLGTFYNAWGLANIHPAPRSTGVAAPPAPTNQDTDVYFYGETLEKLGPRKYKITNGGFTTCVQPTSRWQLASDSIMLNLDHYTLLRNAVFSVKGVPMLYTPILYYPTKKENRATGFLLPTYGVTTLRGQSIHNAFFWAIDRSQDATVMHDWYSNTGQGLGGEYRYNFGGGSDGNLRSYWLNEHVTSYVLADGTTVDVPGNRAYDLQGSASQLLPGGFRARGRVNYSSNLQTMQTLHTNLADASRNMRTFGGNIVGVVKGFSINGTLDHSETFYSGSDSSAITGSWPRVSISRNERPLFGSQLYYSANGELARVLYDTRLGTDERDSGLTRLDTAPQIRYPFKKWAWFTANSTVSFRETFYTRSLDLAGTIADVSLNRRFFDFQSQLTGPVFSRVFNTPENGYAEKFKHSIEPFMTIGRTTAIDNYEQIVKIDGIDGTVGGTRYSYGVSNRIYAKRRMPGTAIAQSREIVSVDFGQSYYTDQRAVQYDLQSSTGHSAPAASHFTPITLNVRVVPSDVFTSNMRAEFDSRYHSLRTISATGSYTAINWLTSSLTWSKLGYIAQLPGFDNPAFLNQYITGSANAHTKDNRYGSIYSFNYDLLHSGMLMQRVTGFYNAQCCGISFEYQTYNLSGVTSVAVPMDRRFFMSFTLAGLGNFSPFNNALSGAPR